MKMNTREKKSHLVGLILQIEAGQSNNSKIILKWLRYDIFCNYLQHKKLKPFPHL